MTLEMQGNLLEIFMWPNWMVEKTTRLCFSKKLDMVIGHGKRVQNRKGDTGKSLTVFFRT